MWTPRGIPFLLIVFSALEVVPAIAAEPVTPSAQEELIEQILELRERLERLLETLPPELRDEVERRWRERSSPAEAARPRAAPSPSDTTEPEAAREVAHAPASGASAADATAPIPLEDCPGLRVFDSNVDGSLSGADRYWRHLRLWLDDGDDRLGDDEIESLYELGVREIDAGLHRYRTSEGTSGEIMLDGNIRLQILGSRSAVRSGRLVIEADRVARAGQYRLVDSTGTSLTGFQVVRPGLELESSDGARSPLWCP